MHVYIGRGKGKPLFGGLCSIWNEHADFIGAAFRIVQFEYLAKCKLLQATGSFCHVSSIQMCRTTYSQYNYVKATKLGPKGSRALVLSLPAMPQSNTPQNAVHCHLHVRAHQLLSSLFKRLNRRQEQFNNNNNSQKEDKTNNN